MRSRWVAWASLSLTFIGCAEPLQNGGVVVLGQAEDRLLLTCLFHRSEDAATTCASSVPAATVRKLGADGGLGGPLATGREGDWLVENGEIAFVVEQAGPGRAVAKGGHLVDVADAVARRDEISQLVPTVDGRPVDVDQVVAGVDPEGVAWVESKGRIEGREGVVVVARYELAPGQRGVSLKQKVTNGGRTPLRLGESGGVLYWGTAEAVPAPESLGVAAAAIGSELAYAWLPVDAAEVASRHEPGVSRVAVPRAEPLRPGASFTHHHFVAVARRGDDLALASEIALLSGRTLGGIAFVAPTSGSREVSLWPLEGATPAPSPWRVTIPASGPEPVILECPPGRYAIGDTGASPSEGTDTVDVEPGRVREVQLPAGKTAEVQLAWAEGEAVAGAFFELESPPGTTVHRGLLGIDGAVVTAAPGPSRLIVNRGAMSDRLRLDLDPSTTRRVEITLPPPLPVGDYAAVDFRQHVAGKGLSSARVSDRIRAGVANDLDFILIPELGAGVAADTNLAGVGTARDIVTLADFAAFAPHAVEVWSGDEAPDRVRARYFERLARGDRRAPIASSGLRSTQGGPHAPRTLVAMSLDRPRTAAELAQALAARADTLVTNGPWIALRVAGARPGETVSAATAGSPVGVSLVVGATDAVAPELVEVWAGSSRVWSSPLTGGTSDPNDPRLRRFETTLRLGESAPYVVAIVRGGPSVPGTPAPEVTPFAMTSAVWIGEPTAARSGI